MNTMITTTNSIGQTLKETAKTYKDNLPIMVVNKIYNADKTFMETVEQFEYDNYCNVTKSTDPIGNVTTYTYDTTYNMQLTKAYPMDRSTYKTYKDTYELSEDKKTVVKFYTICMDSIEIARINYKEFTYDIYGNVVEETDPNTNIGYITHYEYSIPDGITPLAGENFAGVYLTKQKHIGINDADNNPVKNSFGEITGVLEERCDYDRMGNLIAHTDKNGNTTSYQFDVLGRKVKETNPNSTFKQWSYDDTTNDLIITDENGNQIKYDYDCFGNLKAKVDVTLNENLNQYYYDLDFRLIRENNHNTSANSREITYTYDDFDQQLTKVTKDKNSVLLASESYTYEYGWNNGEHAKVTKTLLGDDSASSLIEVTYKDKLDRTIKSGNVVNGIELLTTFEYSEDGEKKSEKTARAYAENWDTSYTTNWNKASHRTYYTIHETDACGNTSWTFYDLKNRKYQYTQDSNDNLVNYYYDSLDRLLRVSQMHTVSYNIEEKTYYDGNGNTIQTLKENGIIPINPSTPKSYGKVTYDYDSMNRLTCAAIYNKDMPYDVTQYYYDKVGNKLRVYTGLDGKYNLDSIGNVVGTTDYSVNKYTYDHMNRVKTVTDGMGKVESYTYDTNGNMIGKVDRNGWITTNVYDGMGRILRSEAKKSATDTNPVVTETQYALTGAVKQEKNANATVDYTYDSLGKKIKETQTGGILKEYTYDTAGNKMSFNLKIGDTVYNNTSYVYNRMNLIQNASENAVEVANYTYNTENRLKNVTYANGDTTEYTYQRPGWIYNVTNKNAAGTIIDQDSYGYYTNGSKSQNYKSNIATKINYVYDGLGHLIEERETLHGSVTDKIVYEYDRYNNRTKMTRTKRNPKVSTYEYSKNNLLVKETTTGTGAGIKDYSYDNNGNQLSDSVEGRSYNALNQQVTYTANDVTNNQTYLPNSLRATKGTVNSKTRHIWDDGNIVADVVYTSPEQYTVTKYIRGTQLIASENSVDGRKYYLYNGDGDVIQLRNEADELLKKYDYYAFGEEKTGYGQPVIEYPNPFRYKGEYYDPEFGTVYLRARYYDPSIGRFTQEDTHWNVGNMVYDSNGSVSLEAILQSGNLYAYCMGNPVKFKDFSGDSVILTCILVGAGIGALISGGMNALKQSREGATFETFNWASLGISTVTGAISGGIAGSPIGLLGQVGFNALLSETESILQGFAKGQKVDRALMMDALFSAILGGAFGVLGGKGTTFGVKQTEYFIENVSLIFGRITATEYYKMSTRAGLNALMKDLPKSVLMDIGKEQLTKLYEFIKKHMKVE